MLVCRHVNISSDVMFVQRFGSIPFMVVLSSQHHLLVVQTWPVHLIHTLYKHLHSPVLAGITFYFNIHRNRKAPNSADTFFFSSSSLSCLSLTCRGQCRPVFVRAAGLIDCPSCLHLYVEAVGPAGLFPVFPAAQSSKVIMFICWFICAEKLYASLY